MMPDPPLLEDDTGPVAVTMLQAMPPAAATAADDEHPAQAVCEQLPDDGG
jgi:hypothetical protein